MNDALTSTSVALDRAPNLLSLASLGAYWSEPGLSFVAIGSARDVPIARAEDALREVDVLGSLDRAIGGPIALVAAPFDPAQPATARIPSTVIGVADDGSAWITVVGHDDLTIPDPRPPQPSPSTFTVRAVRSPESWCQAVVEVTDRIKAGSLDKAVLARELLVEANGPIAISSVLQRLADSFPSCMRWHIDGFVGASPELLVSVRDERVASHPLAGTTARRGDPAADAQLAAGLLASDKNRWEHQITIDALLDTLLPYCSYLDAESAPSIVAVANVQHLGTRVRGHLSDPRPGALELALALHPTPAVGGHPTAAALELIDEIESLDRRRYAGPVGWMNASGDGTFAVGIRSAEISGSTASVFVGNGIVADSVPESELAETRAKSQALLGAIVRP